MKKAFTLIELLVVIAIIAILAAILFPVFAQAKAAAKKTQSLSNTKNLGLGVIMYTGDVDDVGPYANPYKDAATGEWEEGGSWWGPGWVFKTQPYIKNFAVFQAPGEPARTGGAWDRPTLSYQINAYVDEFWNGKYGAVSTGGDWTMTKPSFGSIGRPADTILIGERHHSDYQPKRLAAFGSPEGQGVQGSAPFVGVPWMDSWLGPGETPNGDDKNGAGASNDWPNGFNGTVTPAWSGSANFVFVDGHSKAMKPVQTCPGKWTQPEKNMWDGSRG